MKERSKNSAFLLIALAFFCVYLVRTYYSAPSLPSSLSAKPAYPESAGARLVFGLPIDINKATAKELELLPGIGSVLAARIVKERSLTNGFNSISELSRVKGLSSRRVKALAPYITVGG